MILYPIVFKYFKHYIRVWHENKIITLEKGYNEIPKPYNIIIL